MNGGRTKAWGPLYAIFDPAAFTGGDWRPAVEGALAGGASVLQLRCKSMAPGEIVAWADRLHAVTARFDVPLIINDDPAIAREAGAEGAHLGVTDMAPGAAREMLGPDAIIGVTVHNEAEARGCDVASSDYFGVGPFAKTGSKDDALPPLGVEAFARLCALLAARAPEMPIYAIAGINADNAASAVDAGADGVAVISAIFSTENTQSAARALYEVLERAGKGEQA